MDTFVSNCPSVSLAEVICKKKMDKDTESKLTRLYHDPSQPGALGGIKQLVRLSKDKLDVKLTPKEAQHFLQGQDTYTKHGKVREKGVLNERIVTSGPFDLWEADLMQIPGDVGRNQGYRYLLNVIDAHSKKAWTEPLRDKRPGTMRDAMLRILERGLPTTAVRLNALRTDAGNEFFNRLMRYQVYEPHGINHYRAQKEPGASVVERFNRTLGEKIERYRTTFPDRDIMPVIQPMVDAYNKQWHSMLRSSPNECHQTAIDKAEKGADELLTEPIQPMSMGEKQNEIVSTYLHTEMGRNKEAHQWDPVAGKDHRLVSSFQI